jgi:enterochelin esterase-like enzyme
LSSRRQCVAWLLALTISTALSELALAQRPPDPSVQRAKVFDSYDAFKERLTSILKLPQAERAAALDALWKQLNAANQIPFAFGDRVAFLYHGPASSVAVAGDFNEWNPKQDSARATQVANTDLWILEKTFPADARLDYKLVIDESNWIVDPANSLQMWSGFGGMNSELRMPDYTYPQVTIRREEIPHGQLSDKLSIKSKHLGYDVNYRVYTPAGYDAQQYEAKQVAALPVVYATDGHEYAADHQGSLVIVLDNLIADKKLQPTITVFVDPRDGATGFNRRMDEYGENDNYIAFLADELVPRIDADYHTRRQPQGRVILGTSLGGLNSAWCGATRANVFGKVAVQSPADFAKYAPRTLERYATQPLAGRLQVFVTAGTIGDGAAAPTFAKLLAEKGYQHKLLLTNEGHSWGNFRATLDDILVDLIGPPIPN